MSPTTIEISLAALGKLQQLSDQTGEPVVELLNRAVDDLHRKQTCNTKEFWEAVNAGYAAMKADPAAWAEEQAERRLWDNTLMDGLDPTDRWTDDGGALPRQGNGA